MILKVADSKEALVSELEKQLAAASGDRRKQLERELRNIRAGIKGERDAAYLIDFDYRDSSIIVLHDLRFEINGRVAQIDHLMLNRLLDCVVLETKHFHAGVKITEEGEFLRWNDFKQTFEGMSSPIAQNERHVAVLRDVFAAIDMPTRLGMRLQPRFLNYVLISPESRIDRPKTFDTSNVIKADALKTTFDKYVDNLSILGTFSSATKMVSAETLQAIGQKLVAMHRPSSVAPTQPKSTGALPGSGPLAAEKPVPSGLLAREDDAAPRCKGCGGNNVTIRYGSSYYFKCADCEANTPARVSCGQPQHKERLRKEGQNFFRECADCGTSVLYFINPT